MAACRTVHRDPGRAHSDCGARNGVSLRPPVNHSGCVRRKIDQAGVRNASGNREPGEIEPALAAVEDHAVGGGYDVIGLRQKAVGSGASSTCQSQPPAAAAASSSSYAPERSPRSMQRRDDDEPD